MRRTVAVFVALALSAGLLAGSQTPASPDVLLKAAMQKEQVDGDLPGALALYTDIVAKFPKDAAAPKALLQMAGIYERQGDRAAAQAAYTRVVSEYQGPADVMVVAKRQLAALSDGSPIPRRILNADWVLPQDISANGRYAVGVERTGRVASDSPGVDVVIRDLKTGRSRKLVPQAGAPSISDDGMSVAFAAVDGLGIVRTESGAPPDVIPSPAGASLRPADWAPGGNAVLVSISHRADTLTGRPASVELAWVSPADRGVRSIRTFEPWQAPVSNDTEPRVSPDGRFIAFVAPPQQASSDRFIYVMDSDGRTLEPVVRAAGVRMFPTWAPDGKHLLFTDNRDGRTSLWAIGVENGRASGEPRLLHADPGGDLLGMTAAGALYFRRSTSLSAPPYAGNYSHVVRRDIPLTSRPITFAGCCASWSPDGNALAFIAENGRLVTRAVRSGEERSYELPGAVIASPRWLHDGAAIIAVVQNGPRRETAGFYRVDVSSGETRRLLDVGASRSWQQVGLSPDGNTLYLATRRAAGTFADIVAVDLATGTERPVVSFPPHTRPVAPAIAVSPDGGTLAVAVSTNRDSTEALIFTIAVDGSNYRELTMPHASGWRSIRWTPDGRFLLFPAFDDQRNWRLMRVPADGGAVSFDGLSFKTLAPLIPQIRMIPGNLSGLDVSPDATRVVVSTQTHARFEVWALDDVSWAR